MKKYICKSSIVLYSIFILAGCASSHKSFINRNGEESHVTSCSGASWFDCLNEAGKICGKKGYEITERTSNKIYGFFSNTDFKEVIFVCKTEPINKTNSSASPQSKLREMVAIETGSKTIDNNNESASINQADSEKKIITPKNSNIAPPNKITNSNTANESLTNQNFPANDPSKLEKDINQEKGLIPQDSNVVVNKVNELNKVVINP